MRSHNECYFISSEMENSTTTSLSKESEFPVIPLVVILGVLSVGTVVGNSLVCMAIYTHPALKHVTYFSIFSLGIADLLVGLVAVPSYIIKKLVVNDAVALVVCDTFRFSYFLTGYASILSLCVISVERLIAVKNPLTYQTTVTRFRITAALLIAWFDAIFVSVLPFVPWQKEGTPECNYNPTHWWSIMVIILNVLTPFCFILFCYLYMYTVAQEHIKRMSSGITRSASNISWRRKYKELKERKANITIMIVIGLFILCWFPSSIYYFLQKVCPACFSSSFRDHQSVVNALMKLFTFVSSFCNPIIYCWRSKDFRKAFMKLLLRKKRKLSSSLRETVDAVGNAFGSSKGKKTSVSLSNRSLTLETNSKAPDAEADESVQQCLV